MERNQKISVQGVPQAELACCPAVKELVSHVDAVAALGCCREPEEFPWSEVVNERAVRLCRGMVKLVNDDDVESVRIQLAQFFGGQRLDAGKHVVPLLGFMLANKQLTKRSALHDVAVGAHGLLKNFFSVGYKQQGKILAGSLTQPLVIQRSDDSLSRPGGGDEKISMKALAAFSFQIFQHLHLM